VDWLPRRRGRRGCRGASRCGPAGAFQAREPHPCRRKGPPEPRIPSGSPPRRERPGCPAARGAAGRPVPLPRAAACPVSRARNLCGAAAFAAAAGGHAAGRPAPVPGPGGAPRRGRTPLPLPRAVAHGFRSHAAWADGRRRLRPDGAARHGSVRAAPLPRRAARDSRTRSGFPERLRACPSTRAREGPISHRANRPRGMSHDGCPNAGHGSSPPPGCVSCAPRARSRPVGAGTKPYAGAPSERRPRRASRDPPAPGRSRTPVRATGGPCPGGRRPAGK
jgi:hypothetical protein